MGDLKKKQRTDSDISVNSDDADDSNQQDEILVDFEARNLESSDFHGIRKLLQQLFLKAHIDLSQLTDILIAQNHIGSVIKQAELLEDDSEDEDDVEDVFGLTSVLNMTDRQSLPCVQQITAMLLSRCADGATRQRLSSVLDDASKHVGLVLSERFINIPPQIAAPSYSSLREEMDKAVRKGMNYDFTYFVIICKTCRMPEVATSCGKNKIQRVFINAEEELFSQEAMLSYDYSVREERDMVMEAGDWHEGVSEMEPLRTVLLLPAEHMSRAINTIATRFSLPDCKQT